MPRLRGRTRRVVQAGCFGLALVGLLGLGYALALPGVVAEPAPVLVPTARAVAVPDDGRFGGRVALYGRPPSARPPTRAELGCTLRAADGSPVPADRLSVSEAGALQRRVVSGLAVLPLLALRDPDDGWRLACSGPAAERSRPLYLLRDPGVRDMVPMAVLSLATLLLSLGVAGAVTLRGRG